MLDLKFVRENPDLVKENIKKKFQDYKLPMVDEVIELDTKNRNVKQNGDELRSNRNSLSNKIGILMKDGKKDEANQLKEEVNSINTQLIENEKLEAEYANKIKQIMMKLPNIIDESVPIGKDDSQNVEVEKFGEPITPSYEIPYHTEIMENLCGYCLGPTAEISNFGSFTIINSPVFTFSFLIL